MHHSIISALSFALAVACSRGLTSYADPAWYKNPDGNVARKLAAPK